MIKEIDTEVVYLEEKIEMLKTRKMFLTRAIELVNGMSDDEKQAVYQVLRDLDNEGELCWSQAV